MGKKVTNIVMAVAGGVLAFTFAPAALAGLGLYALVGGGILAGYLVGDLLTPNFKTPDSTPSGQTIRGSKVAARYAFGKFSTGGFLFFAQEQAGKQDTNEWIHLAFAISEGAIEGIDEIFLDEKLISSYGANAEYEVHINRTTCDPYMLANCTDWKDTMIGRNLSWVRVSLKFNQDLFSGLPSFRFVGRGLPVYDPRIGSTQYTDNTSLINRHVLNNILKVPENEIIDEYFIESANISDEIVINPDGSSSKRYTMGCLVGDDENRVDILKKIELATNGHSIRLGGLWGFLVGAYYGAYDLTVTHDDIIGQIEYQTEASNADAINTVTGTFVDPSNSYQDTDYPPAIVDEWVTADNAELVEDLNLKYVNDPYLAQRLAWMKLKQRRNASTVTLNMNYSGYACRPMRVVRLYLPKFNIDGEFIVTNWQMTPPSQANEDGAITVTFQAYDSDMFDDAVGSAYDPLGFISLPTGGLAAPSNLVWIPDGKSDVMQGYLSWTAASDTVNYYSVLIRDSIGDLIQTYQVVGSATICNINGLQAGTYTMSVFAISGILKSSEISVVVDINVPAEPQIVTYSNTIDSITIYASNPLVEKNDWNYEHYFSNIEITNPLTEATRLGTGATITKHGLAFNTIYHFYIRTFNAYGYSGFYHLEANTSNDVSALLSALENQITSSQLTEDLQSAIEDLPNIVNDITNLQGDVSSLETTVNSLNGIIDELLGAPEYDEDEVSVSSGEIRIYEGHLYRADVNMTSPIPIPTNTAYWTDLGEFTSIQEQLNEVSSQIVTLTGVAEGTARKTYALNSQYRRDDGSSELESLVANLRSDARFVEEVQVRASADEALAQRLTTAEASVDDLGSSLTELEQVVSDNQSSTATALTALESQIEDAEGNISTNAGAITSLQTSVSNIEDELESTATALTALEATVTDPSTGLPSKASAEDLTTVTATVDDIIAERTIKVQVRTDGKLVLAGIGLIADSETEQSQIYALADQFAILNSLNGTITSPFIVTGGVVYIASAMIADGTISSAKIADIIQSDNYASGVTGWRIKKDGTAEFNDVTVRGVLAGSRFAVGQLNLVSAYGGDLYCPLKINSYTTVSATNTVTSDVFYGYGYGSGYNARRVATSTATFYLEAFASVYLYNTGGGGTPQGTITFQYQINGGSWVTISSFSTVPNTANSNPAMNYATAADISGFSSIYFRAVFSGTPSGQIYHNLSLKVEVINM